MNHCKFCGKKQDAHTEVHGEPVKPKQGDLSICLYCGTICLFDESLNLEPLTNAELDVLMLEDPDILAFAIKTQLLIREQINKN